MAARDAGALFSFGFRVPTSFVLSRSHSPGFFLHLILECTCSLQSLALSFVHNALRSALFSACLRCAFFVPFSMLLARDGGSSSCVMLYTRRTFVFVRDTTVSAGVFAPIFCLLTFSRSQVSSTDFRVLVYVAAAPPPLPRALFSTSASLRLDHALCFFRAFLDVACP